MLFTGQSEHSIDAKLRLAIPAKHRARLEAARDGKAWYCVPWPTGILRLYTESRFVELAEQGEQTLTPNNDLAELEAGLFGLTERLEMDAQGRIVLPRQHLEFIGLDPGAMPREVIVVGVRNRLEVHDRARWLAAQLERFSKLPDLVARVTGNGGGPPAPDGR